MVLRFCFLFLIISFDACKAQNLPQQKAVYEVIAECKLNSSNIEYFFSDHPNKYVLCLSRGNEDFRMPKNTKFLIYDLRKSEVVYEDEIGNGTVKWYSPFEIMVTVVPGIMRKGETMEDYTEIINISTLD